MGEVGSREFWSEVAQTPEYDNKGETEKLNWLGQYKCGYLASWIG